MLQALHQLHREYVGTSPTGKHMDALKPLEVAQEVIRALGKSLNVPNADTIKAEIYQFDAAIGSLSINFAATPNAEIPSMLVPQLLLFDLQELSEEDRGELLELCNTSNNRAFYQKLANLARTQLGLPQAPITTSEKLSIHFYIEFLNNPELAKDALRYVLGHELGHIFYEDDGGGWKIAIIRVLLAGLTAGVVMVTTLYIPVLAIPVLITAVLINATIIKKLKKSFCHEQEFRADNFAATDKGSTLGAIRYLEWDGKHIKDRESDSHPARSARILKMRERLQELEAPSSPASGFVPAYA
jgi:hypothetical protein